MSVEKKQRKRQADEGQPKAAKPLKKAKKDVVSTPENSDDNASTPAALAKQSPAKSAAVMDAAAFRKAHDITLQHLGTTAAEVYQSFDDAPFPKGIQQALKTSGFTAPTPIQVQQELLERKSHFPLVSAFW